MFSMGLATKVPILPKETMLAPLTFFPNFFRKSSRKL